MTAAGRRSGTVPGRLSGNPGSRSGTFFATPLVRRMGRRTNGAGIARAGGRVVGQRQAE